MKKNENRQNGNRQSGKSPKWKIIATIYRMSNVSDSHDAMAFDAKVTPMRTSLENGTNAGIAICNAELVIDGSQEPDVKKLFKEILVRAGAREEFLAEAFFSSQCWRTFFTSLISAAPAPALNQWNFPQSVMLCMTQVRNAFNENTCRPIMFKLMMSKSDKACVWIATGAIEKIKQGQDNGTIPSVASVDTFRRMSGYIESQNGGISSTCAIPVQDVVNRFGIKDQNLIDCMVWANNNYRTRVLKWVARCNIVAEVDTIGESEMEQIALLLAPVKELQEDKFSADEVRDGLGMLICSLHAYSCSLLASASPNYVQIGNPNDETAQGRAGGAEEKQAIAWAKKAQNSYKKVIN